MSYRDTYPNNIEAPQKVKFQYSHDIEFDYSDGKYPLGEEWEGFDWEEVYIPVKHRINSGIVGKHVWMRTTVGINSKWSLPIRLTDSFINIEQTEVVNDGTTSTYQIKYTLADGTVIYSDPITIINGIDGKGIKEAGIINENLVFKYTDDSIDDLGRVVGHDGTGIPIGAIDYSYITSVGNVAQWDLPINMFNRTLSATDPIIYTNGVISHSLLDGNKHIPTGGNAGDSLLTDGAGNYSWGAYILLSDLDDTATVGDTNKVYSADKILSLMGGSSFGIKYSVNTLVEMNAITGMTIDELCVVNNELNRPVYKYNDTSWVSFFNLDALHNHDDRYYTESELNTDTSAQVHWNNLTNIPSLLQDWNLTGNTGNATIADGDTINIVGSGGVNTSLSGNTLTITASTGATYTAGAGLNLIGTEFSHSNTSSIGNINNSGGTVLQDATFDTYGHVTGMSSTNLDSRYSLLAHTHATLTRGTGLLGNNYNGSSATTWSLSYGGSGGLWGSATSVARSDHSHSGSTVGLTQTLIYKDINSNNRYASYEDGVLKAEGAYTVSSGSIAPSVVSGADGTVQQITVSYTAGSLSTGWNVSHKSGDSIVMNISPSSGTGTNVNVQLTLAGPSGSAEVLRLRDSTGLELDTVNISIT